ncbi:MAG TPA: hypothetical protein VFV58_10925 [Blastocatellia bacterium]|jgi:hypothetical protein|nr:hypothetical protein [Blastocatellia bacterium]
MADYIEIDKLSEDERFAFFSYQDEGGSVGQIKLDKKLGKITLVEAAASDENGGLFTRACCKILEHWSDGKLPDSTYWAS